jgi:hypothetical protein
VNAVDAYVYETNWGVGGGCAAGPDECPAHIGRDLVIAFTETYRQCELGKKGIAPPQLNELRVTITRTARDTIQEIGPGSYDTAPSSQPGADAVSVSRATGVRCPASEKNVDENAELPAYTGKVTIDRRTATTLTGTIDVKGKNDEIVQISFTAPICTTEALAEPTTCCAP